MHNQHFVHISYQDLYLLVAQVLTENAYQEEMY